MSWITTWTESRNNMSWISLIEWNSWTTQVSAVRDAQQVARRKPLYSWYCPSWCLDAKNTFQSVHGFSPFQLAICQNPSFPCAFTDKAPVLLTTQHNKIINGHLNIIHKAPEAFIMNSNSENILRALRLNICTSNGNIFVSGDSVCYKQAFSRRWRSAAKVLGNDGQQVLVKQ